MAYAISPYAPGTSLTGFPQVLDMVARNQAPQQSGGNVSAPGGMVWGDSTTASAPAQASADDLSFLADNEARLRALLGRTDTGLNQGLTQNEDQYNTQVGGANADKERQYANYADQRIDQNRNKLSAYDTINRNAGNGYRSLAQIIGRASGTGSSAFQELLPDVVGKDTSSKRQGATDTFGRNLQGIDKAQGQYDISFADVLADLARQRKANEEQLRTGIEGQRQTINGQLADNAGRIAQANGGGYDAVRAAQAPFQTAIDNSRNQVESFFNQFRTPYTPKQAVAATPEMSAYNTDRSVVNANNGGQPGDPTNPYSALLRKRLQGTA